MNSRLNGWPSPEWKAALFAAIEPDGPPVEIEPTFDEYYLIPYGIANVTVLVDYNFVNEEYASNIFPFLYLSGVENIFRWNNATDSAEFNDVVQFSNALIIPGYNNNFTPETKLLLRAFVYYESGNLVWTGSRVPNLILVSDIFDNRRLTFATPLEYPNFGYYLGKYYYFPDGFNLISNRVYNSPFESDYQRPYLLSFPSSGAIIPNAIREFDYDTNQYINEYCPYVFGFTSTNTYCGVWSRDYGTGRISVLSNNFKDQ